MPFELSLPEPLSPLWGLAGGGRWGDTHIPEGGKPRGAQPPPQSPREGPVVPLGLKHVGLQEGDVVPDHPDEGLAERRESRGCHICRGRSSSHTPGAPASLGFPENAGPAHHRALPPALSRLGPALCP